MKKLSGLCTCVCANHPTLQLKTKLKLQEIWPKFFQSILSHSVVCKTVGEDALLSSVIAGKSQAEYKGCPTIQLGRVLSS